MVSKAFVIPVIIASGQPQEEGPQINMALPVLLRIPDVIINTMTHDPGDTVVVAVDVVMAVIINDGDTRKMIEHHTMTGFINESDLDPKGITVIPGWTMTPTRRVIPRT